MLKCSPPRFEEYSSPECTGYHCLSNRMSFKVLARLKSSLSRTPSTSSTPEYSIIDPNKPLASPSYEEVVAGDVRNRTARRIQLVRTVSESSYTSMEFSEWLNTAEETGQTDAEELPAYEERPQMPILLRSVSAVSAVTSSRSQPHAMCPCAQCHRLR